MAIDKLNFSGINSGSKDFDTPLGSVADRLTKYGLILNQQDAEKAKQKRLDEQDAYQKQRDTLVDSRYEADKKERLEDKNRLLQKDYNTANAMSAIENKDAYIAGRISSEQKAIQDTMASATPEERLQMQQELKGYDPKASGQQWADTALSQSNVDAKDITNLKRDIAKEAEQTRQFNENKRIAQENADRAYSLQKIQYEQQQKERADRLQEKTDAKAAKIAGVETFTNLNGVENSTKSIKDSKDGEKYIPTENLEAHKKSYEEFANSPEIIRMKNELVEAQKNGGQIYTKEQLADPVFMKKLYDESPAGQKSQGSGLLKNVLPESLFPNREMLRDVQAASLDIQKYKAIKSDPKSTGADIAFADEKLSEIEKNISGIKNKYTNKDSNTNFLTYDDFSKKIKADNASKELDLKTKTEKYDSAYKAQDLKLKNDFGKIKQEEIYVPKSEDQYAQDIIKARFEKAKADGKTLSADEQYAIMLSAKDIAKTHQEKVEKAEDDAIKVRLKKMETASDAKKTLIGTIEKENASIRQLINDASREDKDKSYEYVVGGKKTNNKEAYIAELQAELYQNNNRIDKALETKD